MLWLSMLSLHLEQSHTRCVVTAGRHISRERFLEEVAIMSFQPSYKEQTRDEQQFVSELGWLAAASFAIILIAL